MFDKIEIHPSKYSKNKKLRKQLKDAAYHRVTVNKKGNKIQTQRRSNMDDNSIKEYIKRDIIDNDKYDKWMTFLNGVHTEGKKRDYYHREIQELMMEFNNTLCDSDSIEKLDCLYTEFNTMMDCIRSRMRYIDKS